jgi:hypothetical protein
MTIYFWIMFTFHIRQVISTCPAQPLRLCTHVSESFVSQRFPSPTQNVSAQREDDFVHVRVRVNTVPG